MSERVVTLPQDSANNNQSPSNAVHPSIFRYDSLQDRARRDFFNFKEWAIANPDSIAEHFELYEQHFSDLQKRHTFAGRLAHYFTRHRSPASEKEQEYADYFGITNLGRLPEADLIAEASARRKALGPTLTMAKQGDLETTIRSYASRIPGGVPDDLVRWSSDRLQKLYYILPEFVIQNNGMEKVIRVMMGVVALTAVETFGTPEEERSRRIAESVRPAYFYAATYPIVDDILQDSKYIQGSEEKTRYHDVILKGLSTGDDIDESKLPDHPLTEEMLANYNTLRELLPFATYRDTYHTLESMYRAQHEDANRTAADIANEADLYVPLIIKASLSRIVAHTIPGRTVSPERSDKMLKTLLRQQLADDHRDIVEDLNEGRLTPFTLHIMHPGHEFANPLYYRMAQEAYISHEVYGQEDSERVQRALSGYGAHDMLRALGAQPPQIKEHFSDQGGPIDHLMRVASGIGKRAFTAASLTPDKEMAEQLNKYVPERDPQLVDPRTYISDALPYVNEVLLAELSGGSELEEVMRYALEAGGKRIRPALTLMLAESLGIERKSIEPLLISSEFAHTASLIFDDLPAQDNATLRRGKEATHIKFPEYDAQLAGISMISHGVGVLGRLGAYFPADRVNEVVEYTGTILGAKKLCLGQHMDLDPNRYDSPEEVIEMYSLKTSTMIEGALVPLMLLNGRPREEIRLIQRYAYHAGIIFQLQDDLLDATSSAEVLGKNSKQDEGKQNIVTMLGVEAAQSKLDEHLEGAVKSLAELPFPTTLLEELTLYFAARKR